MFEAYLESDWGLGKDPRTLLPALPFHLSEERAMNKAEMDHPKTLVWEAVKESQSSVQSSSTLDGL